MLSCKGFDLSDREGLLGKRELTWVGSCNTQVPKSRVRPWGPSEWREDRRCSPSNKECRGMVVYRRDRSNDGTVLLRRFETRMITFRGFSRIRRSDRGTLGENVYLRPSNNNLLFTLIHTGNDF